MNLEDYGTLFVLVTLMLTLIVASPMLAMVVSFEGSSEQFTELWLLDPNHAAENYPFNISAGEMYSVFVGLGNNMGNPEYYKIFMKFGNTTQLDFNSSKPSSLHPLYEFRGFVGDGDIWESPVTFELQNVSLVDKVLYGDNVTVNASIEDSVLSVNKVIINGIAFPVDAYTSWDSENSGFYYCLSFELWRYDMVLKSFRFHDCIVGLRLNTTDSQLAKFL